MAANQHNTEAPATVSPETHRERGSIDNGLRRAIVPRSYLIDDSPLQTMDNCQRLIALLRAVDHSSDLFAEAAEMAEHQLLGELSSALDHIERNELCHCRD